jgi:hypothetical protein
MPEDDKRARKEDYWERVEADAATVVDHLEADADDWDIIGVDVAGDADDGDTLFLLVIRRKVSQDGNLLISERYYKYDVLDREGKWVSNGIERRVSGSLPAALKVLYTALDNGDLQADDPMLMDSRQDGLEHGPESLTTPVSTLRGDDTADTDDGDDLERDPRLKESAEGTTSNTVTCDQCEADVPRSEAVNMGGGIGVDMWICEGQHAGFGGDDDE